MRELDLPEPVAVTLVRRGFRTVAEAGAFLEASERHDPFEFGSMAEIKATVERAIGAGRTITVHGDYDCDGVSATAILVRTLRSLGAQCDWYIPDRLGDGYGLTTEGVERLAARGTELLIAADCGITCVREVAAARAAGMEVIVTDHHEPGDALPECPVLHPRLSGYPFGELCAAGVAYKLASALAGAEEAGRDLDLVALATVADVAPLVGLNRALVRQGLTVMARGARPGIAALAEVARMTGLPSTYGLGFLLGPRVNAGGRIGAADLGARLLATDDPHEAAALAARLHGLNAERREIEAAVRAEAEAQAGARAEGPLVWAAGEGWHPGVVGIVAARLKESFGRPSVVIGFAGDEGKGSGRSVAGVDLGAAVARLAREGLIARGGGHRMAAGVSLSRGQLEPAMARLGELLASQGADAPRARSLRVDGLVAPGGATPELALRIAAAGPYGAGAPAPRLALAAVRLAGVRRIGDGHLALSLADRLGGRLDAVAFRAFEGPLGAFLIERAGGAAHLAGRLERDDWNGRARVKLHVEDAGMPG
jgi:single-stranded-DNA-specific exonuclease